MGYLEKNYHNFTKGLHKTENVDMVASDELLEARNIVLLPDKGYTIRPGLESIIDSNSIPFAYPFNVILDPKGRGYLIFTGAKLYILTDLVDPDLTLIADTISFEEGLKTITPIYYGGKLYFVTGTQYYEWDLDLTHLPVAVTPYGDTSLDHIKECTILMERSGWFYASGRADYPNDVYYSEVSDPTRFEATSILTANTNDGDSIKGLSEYLKTLIVGKNNHLHAGAGIDPVDDLIWYPLAASEGFTGPRAFATVNNSLGYLGRDGVYMLESVDENRLSVSHYTSKLRDFITSIPTKNIKTNSQMTHIQNKLFITAAYPNESSVPTINDMIMVGHTNLIYPEHAYLSSNPGYQLPFTTWDGVDFYPLCLLENLDDEILVFHKAGNYVFLSRFKEGLYKDQFSDSAISVETRHKIDLNKPMNIKKFNSLVVYMRQYESLSSTIKLAYKVDYQTNGLTPYTFDSDDSHIFGESTWGADKYGWIDSVPLELPIRKGGYTLELHFTHNEIDEPLTMYGFGIKYKLKRLKGVK